MHPSNCRICGKALTDPASVESGVGPVCRVAEKTRLVDDRRQDLFGYERSTYSYDEVGDVICIVDHDRGRTVTTDADRVVEDLVECLGSLAGRRVIYRDTRGVWDEIVVRGDTFACFRPIDERDREAALTKVLRGHVQRVTPVSTLAEFLGGAGPVEVAQGVTDRNGKAIRHLRLL